MILKTNFEIHATRLSEVRKVESQTSEQTISYQFVSMKYSEVGLEI